MRENSLTRLLYLNWVAILRLLRMTNSGSLTARIETRRFESRVAVLAFFSSLITAPLIPEEYNQHYFPAYVFGEPIPVHSSKPTLHCEAP